MRSTYSVEGSPREVLNSLEAQLTLMGYTSGELNYRTDTRLSLYAPQRYNGLLWVLDLAKRAGVQFVVMSDGNPRATKLVADSTSEKIDAEVTEVVRECLQST